MLYCCFTQNLVITGLTGPFLFEQKIILILVFFVMRTCCLFRYHILYLPSGSPSPHFLFTLISNVLSGVKFSRYQASVMQTSQLACTQTSSLEYVVQKKYKKVMYCTYMY